MNRFFLFALVLAVLSGCSKTTEEICAETNQLLKEKMGHGFVDTGYIGCLKLTPKEAQQSLDGLRENLKAKAPVIRSRKEVAALVAHSTPEILIHEFGMPSSVMYVPQPFRNNTINYSPRSMDVADHDEARLIEILGLISKREDADFLMSWDKPLSVDLFGVNDKSFGVFFIVKDNAITDKIAKFPDYFWERWWK